VSAARERAREVVERWLAEAAAEEVDGPHGPARVEHEVGARPGEYVVQLPGERKLRTGVSLLLGDHSLSVSAFVVRNPDEEHARVHRWLLERNARLRQVAFALDRDGDVYLRGRLPLDGVTGATLDSLLGEVLEVADSSFDELLALGFLTSMRKEWAWRTSRGESTRNLEAFRHLLDDGAGSRRSGPQG
jgi:hypothetical protein